MRVFSDTPIEDAPIQKQTILPHGKDFPNKPLIPSLYFNDTLNGLYIALDQWHMVPTGSIDQVNAFKSASSVRVVRGNQIPCDRAGTYLIDSGLAEGKIITLPVPGVVAGLIFNIKNFGKKYVILDSGIPEVTIDQYEKLTVHPYQTVTIQYFEGRWHILNMYIPSQL
jgi:hypothetical protein